MPSTAGSSTTPKRPLRGWLHGIVSHAALDALRRRRVRTLALPLIGQVRESATAGGFPDDPARQVAERDQVADAMRDLKPDARAALALRHYYGYDYAEIGRLLRTSPGNVGSILSRAHVVLRSWLAADESDPPTDLPAPRRALR